MGMIIFLYRNVAYPRFRRPATVVMLISKSTLGWMMKFPSLIGWIIQDNMIFNENKIKTDTEDIHVWRYKQINDGEKRIFFPTSRISNANLPSHILTRIQSLSVNWPLEGIPGSLM
jgi:hypothetical protein